MQHAEWGRRIILLVADLDPRVKAAVGGASISPLSIIPNRPANSMKSAYSWTRSMRKIEEVLVGQICPNKSEMKFNETDDDNMDSFDEIGFDKSRYVRFSFSKERFVIA